MTDYIKREEAEKIFVEYNCVKHHVTEMGDTNEANKIILMFRENAKKLFSLAHSEDVAPVVRCKDCKHRYITGSTTHYYVCDFMDAEYNDNGYCHHGERKDDE